MTKQELLKKIGFSEEYISHLNQMEDFDRYVFEAVGEEYQWQITAETNVIIDESINNFPTIFNIDSK